MKCREIRKSMVEYLEQGKQFPACEDIKTHLASCSECAAFSSRVQEALDFIESEKEVVHDPFMFTRIQELCVPNHNTPRIKIRQRVLQAIYVTAVLALMMFVGSMIGERYAYNHSISVDYQTELYYFSNIHMDSQVYTDLSQQNTEP